MAEMSVAKKRKFVNPGKKKRKLSALHKRQRAAVRKNAGKNSFRKQKKSIKKSYPATYEKYGYKRGRTKRLKRNVGSIVTVFPAGMNPGRKRRKRYVARKKNRSTKKIVVFNKGEKMATRRRRRTNKARRHRNTVYRRRIKRGLYQYSSNPGRRRRRRHSNVSVRHRRHRRNPARRYHRRRNPGFLSGTGGRVFGVIGGVAVTKLLSGFLPASFSSGMLSYLGIGAIAVIQGKVIGKISKSSSLGNDFMVGGLAYLTAKLLSDFLPSLGSYTGISGMGLIGGSSFYTPQVNQQGSMGTFVLPAAVSGAIPVAAPAKAGVGTLRRMGRLM